MENREVQRPSRLAVSVLYALPLIIRLQPYSFMSAAIHLPSSVNTYSQVLALLPNSQFCSVPAYWGRSGARTARVPIFDVAQRQSADLILPRNRGSVVRVGQPGPGDSIDLDDLSNLEAGGRTLVDVRQSIRNSNYRHRKTRIAGQWNRVGLCSCSGGNLARQRTATGVNSLVQ